MPTKKKMKNLLKKLVTKDPEPPRRRDGSTPTTPSSAEVDWKGDGWKKKSPWSPPPSTPSSPSVLATPPPMPAPPADPQDGLGKVASSDKIGKGTMAKDRSSPLPWWETADNGDDQQNGLIDEVKPAIKLRSWDNDPVPWWEQNDDDGGGGGTTWGKESRSRTESPASNEQQTKPTRTRSRQSQENGEPQSNDGSRLMDHYNTNTKSKTQVEPVETNKTQPRRRQRPPSSEPFENNVSQSPTKEIVVDNTQPRRRQRPPSSEPFENNVNESTQSVTEDEKLEIEKENDFSSTNDIVIDKEKYEQVNECLQSVTEDDGIRIEEEKDLSSTNGIVIDKGNDEQVNESLQLVIEDGQLGIEEERELSPTLQKGKQKGLKKGNSNKKQIKYNVRHSTWGIDHIPEELLEVNNDKSTKSAEFDRWKIEQSTKEVNANDEINKNSDKSLACDSWGVENNDNKDSPKALDLQHNNDIESINFNTTCSHDNNKNETEENLSENVTKCETSKYNNQKEANLDNFKDPITEVMDLEQKNKQENSSEISKSTAAELIITDQENVNESQPIFDQNIFDHIEYSYVKANQILESDIVNNIDLETSTVPSMETKSIEVVNIENEEKIKENVEINETKANCDKIVFDKNQCDTWNFEGFPNLEIEEDRKIIENSNVIEDKEKNNCDFSHVVVGINNLEIESVNNIPNLEIENKDNNNQNRDESCRKSEENYEIPKGYQCILKDLKDIDEEKRKIYEAVALCLNEEKVSKIAKMLKNEMESIEEEKETRMVFDKNKCDTWNFEELGVPNLEDETINKAQSNENNSSKDEKEAIVKFDKNKCDTWNFEELPNLSETDNHLEDEATTKAHINENNSSKDEKEEIVKFDKNKCDTWNFEGYPNISETDNHLEDETITKAHINENNSSKDEKEAIVKFDKNKCDTWNFEGLPNLSETDNHLEEDKLSPRADEKEMRNSNDNHQSEVVASDRSQSASVMKNKNSECKITHKPPNQSQYEDFHIYEDIEVKLPKDEIKEVKTGKKHLDDAGIYEDVEINTTEERKRVDINRKRVTIESANDGENEDPITDKTNDLNRKNNNSNNKLSEKSKVVDTNGTYIFESPTEEKQIQNGIDENKDENVEAKTKKTKKKSKKSEGDEPKETDDDYSVVYPKTRGVCMKDITAARDQQNSTKQWEVEDIKTYILKQTKKDDTLIEDKSNKEEAEQSDPPFKIKSKPKKEIGPTHMVGCYLMSGDADEPEDTSTQAKPAKKAKKAKKIEKKGSDGVVNVGDLFEVCIPEPKRHPKSTTSSWGAYVCVMDEFDDEPELEKPVKKTKKKKKVEVKEEEPAIIYDYDEDRVDLLMKEHKAKKERQAMGITEETSDLQEEPNESNHNDISVDTEHKELIIKKRERRDSTELKEAEELFEAIDSNMSSDEQLEAMLKWQEEQEEEERQEEQKRKERLAEKQRQIEEEAAQERKKREEEKKMEDVEWNKKIEERKKKIQDLKNQEEERERKMVEEKAKKEVEIRFKLEDEAKYRREILKEQENLLNTITEDFKKKEVERRKGEEEFHEREEARRLREIEKHKKEMLERKQMEKELRKREEERIKRREEWNRKQDEKRMAEEKKREKLRRQKQEELWKREEERRKEDVARKKQKLRELQDEARRKREEEESSDDELPDFDAEEKKPKKIDGKDFWACDTTDEEEDLPDFGEKPTKKKKKKKNDKQRGELFGERKTNWWDEMDADPNKDWSSSSKRDFTKDGSPVVEWWASDSMGLAPVAPAKVNVAAAREKRKTGSSTNWWDEELKALEECTSVPDGIPAPPPPPPPPPGVPGAPPPPPPPPGMPGMFVKKPTSIAKKAKLEAIKKAARTRQDWGSIMKDIEGGLKLKKVGMFDRNDRSNPILPSSRSKGGKFVYDSEKKNEHNELLHQIHRGVRLRKGKTNDRSHPDFKALGLKKLRRQNTREEQPSDPVERLPSSDEEEEDIDKMRDDLQANKGQLEEEVKKRKKLEKENKILNIDLEGFHSQVKRLKRQLRDAGIKEAKPLENGDSEIIPSSLQKSLSKIRVLDRRHSEIDFSDFENIDIEVNNLKNEIEAQKKLANDYLRLRDEATQKLIISENEVEELEMRSNYFERKYKDLQREKGIELPDIEMVGIQTDPIEFADPEKEKRSKSPVDDSDEDDEDDFYSGTRKSSSRRSFTKQLSRMESFVEEDEDSKKDKASSSSSESEEESEEEEEEEEEEKEEEEQDPTKKAQAYERQLVQELKEFQSKYERAKDRELNAKKERTNLRERIKKYYRDMKSERERYLKIRQEMDDFKKECKVEESESEYETDDEAETETIADNDEGGGWWFDEPKPKPKKLRKKKKKTINENGEVDEDEEDDGDLQDLSVFDEPAWSDIESDSEEEDITDDTFLKLMHAKEKTQHYEENITVVKKGNYQLKADIEKCDEKLGVEKRRRTRLEEELHIALSEVS